MISLGLRSSLAVLCGLLLGMASQAADSFPDHPIRLIVGFPAGGTSDLVARVVAERASRVLGQQVIVDNRPGAGGNLSMELAARATPDGYTLGYCTIGTCAINAAVYRDIRYNVTRDFAPVLLIGTSVNVLAASVKSGIDSVKQLVDRAKAQPGKLNYGSSGHGTSPHLCGELFKQLAGVEIEHVPYKGSAPAITDLRGGQIDMFFDNAPSITPHVKSGGVRGLATTGAKRSRGLPDLPTMQEAGFKGFVLEPWFGIVAPIKTPPAIVQRLNQAFDQALADPQLRTRLQDLDMVLVGGSAERLAQQIRLDSDRWGKLARTRGITADQ